MAVDGKEALRTAWRLVTSSDWPFVAEFRFHPVRKWRFDWADPVRKLAIEIEGVVWGGAGRHQTAKGLAGDCEKYNTAAEMGWVVLRYTPQMIKASPVSVIEQIVTVAELRPLTPAND